MSDEQVMSPAPETPENGSLSINDIQNVLTILDYAADQGAFKGFSTFQQVLEVRNRFQAFVDAWKALQEKPVEEPLSRSSDSHPVDAVVH